MFIIIVLSFHMKAKFVILSVDYYTITIIL